MYFFRFAKECKWREERVGSCVGCGPTLQATVQPIKYRIGRRGVTPDAPQWCAVFVSCSISIFSRAHCQSSAHFTRIPKLFLHSQSGRLLQSLSTPYRLLQIDSFECDAADVVVVVYLAAFLKVLGLCNFSSGAFFATATNLPGV